MGVINQLFSVFCCKPSAGTSSLRFSAVFRCWYRQLAGRLWRFKFSNGGVEMLLAIGAYPDTPLKRARERRDEARRLLAEGIDADKESIIAVSSGVGSKEMTKIRICLLTMSLVAVSACSTEPRSPPQPVMPSQKHLTTRPPTFGEGFPSVYEFFRARGARTGKAAVNVCVGTDGRLTEDPTIAQSSGSPAFDRAAIAFASAASGHFAPALEIGRPVAQCYVFRVKYGLPPED